MATANDVINMALLELGVIAAGETPSSGESQDALTRLNVMLHGLKVKGIDMAHTDLALADTIDLPDDEIESVMYLLAKVLAPGYEVGLSADTAQGVSDGEALLSAKYADPAALTVDLGLRTNPPRGF